MVFGGSRVFPYSVHLMPIAIIVNKIDQYLDLPHRLGNFRVLARTLTHHWLEEGGGKPPPANFLNNLKPSADINAKRWEPYTASISHIHTKFQ